MLRFVICVRNEEKIEITPCLIWEGDSVGKVPTVCAERSEFEDPECTENLVPQHMVYHPGVPTVRWAVFGNLQTCFVINPSVHGFESLCPWLCSVGLELCAFSSPM